MILFSGEKDKCHMKTRVHTAEPLAEQLVMGKFRLTSVQSLSHVLFFATPWAAVTVYLTEHPGTNEQ